MAEPRSTGKLWLSVSATAEIALAITLNRYSALLPGWAILLAWGFPLLLLLVWLFREEKAKTLGLHFRQAPFTYCLMFFILTPFVAYTTKVFWVKVFSASARSRLKAEPPTATPQLPPRQSVSIPVPKTQPEIENAPGKHIGKPAPQEQIQRGAQVGRANRQAQIVSLDQSGAGDCNQRIGIGDGNTLNCVPPPLSISDSQLATAMKVVSSSKGLSGEVTIIYELSAENGKDVADKIRTILASCGVSSEVQWAGTFMVPGAPSYKRLSFAYVNNGNSAIANAIEQALLKAGVVSKPMPPDVRDGPASSIPLHIVIRQ